MNNKICIITNIGTHYRYPIYKEIAKEFSCVFYLGDHVQTPIKTFDYATLPGYKGTLKNKFFHHFYWQKGSVKLLNANYKYYILDGEPYCLSSWVILLLAKLKKKKTIAWTHGWYGRESFIKKCIKKTFYNLHDKLMVYNEYAIGLMKEVGIKPEMYCIANSLDSDKEREIRKSIQYTSVYKDYFGNDYPTIIYCGRIQKWKKLEMLVDSIAELKEQGIKVNAVFVGKDVESVNLQSYAQSKNVDKQVWMYGPCYDDKTLAELFYNAQVCVSPGNVGLTAIHSLAFGCPVITHGDFPYQGPEFEAIRPNKTGDFFARNEERDLTKKIKKWITLSPQERDKVRQCAYSEVDNKWNIHYQISTIKKVITEE
nr:glycosyltransferase [Prevotella sp.]